GGLKPAQSAHGPSVRRRPLNPVPREVVGQDRPDKHPPRRRDQPPEFCLFLGANGLSRLLSNLPERAPVLDAIVPPVEVISVSAPVEGCHGRAISASSRDRRW